jgi:hypothetical protein
MCTVSHIGKKGATCCARIKEVIKLQNFEFMEPSTVSNVELFTVKSNFPLGFGWV